MGFSSSGGAKVGTIEMWGGSTAPDGYLLCNGGTISRTLYKDLFAVIGTTYGAGDGSTTFKLPNGTNVVNSVNTNVPVKGDGKNIGLTNGSINTGMVSYGEYGKMIGVASGAYGGTLPNTNLNTGNKYNNNDGIGITTDASKSGIVGTVTRSIMNCKYIIKY